MHWFKFLFHFSKELEAYVNTLGQLRACLYYLQKLVHYCKMGDLFVDQEALSSEEYQTGRITYDGGGTAQSGDVLWTMLRVSGRTSHHILCRFTIRNTNKCSLDGACKLCTSIVMAPLHCRILARTRSGYR